MGFDFAGTYTKVVPHELIECNFGDRTLDEFKKMERFNPDRTWTPVKE